MSADPTAQLTAQPTRSATQLAVAIARAYYLEGLSKVEIAKLHDLSRFKVARILEDSLASGLVRIEIADVGSNDAELAEQLRQRYHLHRAVVVNGPFRDPDALRPALGRAAADLLAEVVTADDVLGVAWGRTLSAMADQVRDLPACEIVQLTGIAGSVATNNADLVRQLLSASRGAHYPLYAPLVVPDAQTAAGLARQPSIKATMAQWKRVSLAVVAVGSWDADGSQLYPVLEPHDHTALRRRTVARDVRDALRPGGSAARHHPRPAPHRHLPPRADAGAGGRRGRRRTGEGHGPAQRPAAGRSRRSSPTPTWRASC